MKKPSKRAKDTARSALSEKAAILAAALYMLGLDTGNEKLKSEFNVSLSIVSGKISKSGLLRLSKEMIKAANENIGRIKSYTITPEFIAAMQAKLDAFEKTIE